MLGSAEKEAYATQPTNCFRIIPIYMTTIPQHYGRTTCRSNTVLCVASHGNKKPSFR